MAQYIVHLHSEFQAWLGDAEFGTLNHLSGLGSNLTRSDHLSYLSGSSENVLLITKALKIT